MAYGGLSFTTIVIDLCKRFNLTTKKNGLAPQTNLLKRDLSVDDTNAHDRHRRDNKTYFDQKEHKRSQDDFAISYKSKRS